MLGKEKGTRAGLEGTYYLKTDPGGSLLIPYDPARLQGIKTRAR